MTSSASTNGRNLRPPGLRIAATVAVFGRHGSIEAEREDVLEDVVAGSLWDRQWIDNRLGARLLQKWVIDEPMLAPEIRNRHIVVVGVNDLFVGCGRQFLAGP